MSVALVPYTACKAKASDADIYLSWHTKRFNNDSHTKDEWGTKTDWEKYKLKLHCFYMYHYWPASYSKCQHSKQTSIQSGVANYLCVPDFDLCERNWAEVVRTGIHTSHLQQWRVDELQQVTVHKCGWTPHCPFHSIYLMSKSCLTMQNRQSAVDGQ